MAEISSFESSLHSDLDYLKLNYVQNLDVELGKGAYGRVFEVECAGMNYAAKEIHPIFFNVARPEELEKIKKDFLKECRIWSKLRHPKIVGLIGVYLRDCDPNTAGIPIMVMEKMQCSLRALIEKQGDTAMSIGLRTKLSIMHDVSLGLWHLHNQDPLIIHRDLTPNNVLVHQGAYGFEAKISDLGVSKVMADNTDGHIMTQVPGTPDFMPPETFVDSPEYGKAVDVFSYAGIVLFAMVEQWPTPKPRVKVNPKNKKIEVVSESEVERRQEYLSKLTAPVFGGELKELVVLCLDDTPELRPEISEVSGKIKKFTGICEGFDSIHVPLPICMYPTKPSHSSSFQVEDKKSFTKQNIDDDKSAEPSDGVHNTRIKDEETFELDDDELRDYEIIDMESVLMQEMDDNKSTKALDRQVSKEKFKHQIEKIYKTMNVQKLKLTMKDALLIQCDLPYHKDLQKVEAKLLPYVTLNKIMTCEYENGLCCYNISSNDWDHGYDNVDDNNIHPVDNLLILIHCSDNILRQNIMLKLSLCQVAIPLLLPNHSNDTVTFLLWAMQSIVKKWSVTTYIESPIVDYPLRIVSFLRIGSVSISKSNILNHVIGNLKFFFFMGCNEVYCKKLLTEGLVDLCCYLPSSSTTNYDNPILFLNLHGDARKSKKQIKFIQKLSMLSVVFIKREEMNENALQIINKLAKHNDQTILFIESLSKQNLIDNHHNIVVRHFKPGFPIEQFQHEIQKIINQTIKNSEKDIISLKQSVKTAKSCGINIDEDDKDCKEGYRKAHKIFNQLNEYLKECSPEKVKLKSFPLQGPDSWPSWTEINRKHYQELGKHTSDLEKYNADNDTEKMKIRKIMEGQCKNLKAPVTTFLNLLSKSSYSITTKHYFLIWLKLLLDEYNRKVFDNLYKKKCSADDKYNAIIGVEHFFREMGQIYETVKCVTKECNNYPRIMAQLMIDGYCAELIDGDTTHVPVEWISAVFKELQTICNATKLCTVSIVGVQSTGKSTLLNTMFGINFNVCAGKCTRGAFMQLLSFHEDAKKQSKCDYLLLIDTEGLNSSTLSFVNKKYDNELATFLVGLADIAIINMNGESLDNLKDTLQIVSHGLIRIKSIEINTSCKFVHNQITEPGAEIKIADEKEDFLKFLDKCVQKACELEYCIGKYKSFTELMKFDKNRDILCLKPLWDGNPPMAKINLQYAEHIQKFKMSLINHAGQHTSHCSFEGFSIKITTLWNAVLREQFLFSFKSILEVIVRKECDQKLNEWDTEFRLRFLEWDSNAKVLLKKDRSQDPKQMLLKEVEKDLRQTLDIIIEGKDDYFKNSKYAEILKEWENKITEKIFDYFQEYMKQAKYSITQLFIEHNREIKAQEMICTIHAKLSGLADDLFSSYLDERLSDKILEEKFNKEWSAWLDEIPSVKYRSPNEIESQILLILQKYFRMDIHLINKKLVKTPLIEWNTTFEINTEVHLHLIPSPKFPMQVTEISGLAESLACRWLEDCEFTYIEKDYSFQGVLLQFDQWVSKLIKEVERTTEIYEFFQFTKECVCDIVLTASKRIEDLLISLEEKARKNDAKHELEKKKNDYFQLLCVLYNSKTDKEIYDKVHEQERLQADRLLDSHTEVIEYLCAIIGNAITKSLMHFLKYEINKDITVSNPIFKSKKNFKLSVLKLLLKKECFGEYRLYLTDPRRSFEKWMHFFVNEHCLKIDHRTNCTKFDKLKDSKLQNLLESVQAAITATNIDSNNLTFSFWMGEFAANMHTMSEDVSLSNHDLKNISKVNIPWKSLEDVKAFKGLFLKQINPTLVKKDSQTFYGDMKDDLNNYMWNILKRTLLGCTARCPFCKEMCDAKDVCDNNEKHFIKLHRPKCLAKVLQHPSRNIVVDICTTSVGTHSKFRNVDTSWNWKPYNQYQTLYPSWFISNTTEPEDLEYWKWVIACFGDDIANWCGFGKNKGIPPQWRHITKTNASDSLNLPEELHEILDSVTESSICVIL